MIRAYAPGRVNVIGEHTDHTGGLVLPAAIDLGTTVTVERGGDVVELVSTADPTPARVPIGVTDPADIQPGWARYVAGVVAELRPELVALALGFDGEPIELARLCQRAEQRASGVPCGIMDQLASAAGVEGSLLLIDCGSLERTPVAFDDELMALVIIDSGQARALASSEYAARARECAAAETHIGPLRSATLDDVATLAEPLRRRARHVVSENRRVLDFVDALRAGDPRAAGELMTAGHASLRDDFEVSTPVVDALVERLLATPGVHGARLTGAGFGGTVVALTEPDARVDGGRRVRPCAGATVDRT